VVVWPGWLKDDAGDWAGNGMAAKPGHEGLDPLGVVGELAGVACRVKVHIERCFADVSFGFAFVQLRFRRRRLAL